MIAILRASREDPMSFGTDYYDIDELLVEDERLIRGTVRTFVEKQVLPEIGHCFREGRFPADLIPQLGVLGVLGANLHGHGCAGLGPVAYGLVMQELERGDSGLRSFASVQGSLVMWPILTFGTDEQRERWLPPLARGEAVGCFGLTEPDFGSNPAGMRTRARRHGADFVLNGAKRWITSGSIADVAIVWARVEDEFGAFLVERGTPGFTVRDIEGKLSLRASVTSELILEDVLVPASARLPGATTLGAALRTLNEARYGIAWGVLGAAMACYEEALAYARERVQFVRPIAGYQLTQNKLVDMLQELTKGQLLAWRLGRLKEAGRLRPGQISLAKRNNVHAALVIARTAREILGANGITDSYQCGRHMLNLESVSTYEGTHEMHTLIVGEEITGLAAYT
jgi:glutaryl-CoA dehydrogenase